MNTKLRILLVLWDGGGVIPPCMAVAQSLRARGHSVIVLGDPTIEPEARAAGCEFTAWQKAPHRTSRHRDADILHDYNYTNMGKYFREELRPYFIDSGDRWTDDVLAAIDRFDVDLVLHDFFVMWAGVAAEARGLPFGVLCTTPYPIPEPGVRPSGSALLPVPGLLAPVRDALFRTLIEYVYSQFKARLNEVRGAHALPPVQRALDQLRRADAILVLTAPAFDYVSPRVPKNVTWVGAPNSDPSWAAPYELPFDPDDARPLVLVGLSSTFQNQTECLRRIVTALSSLPVRAVLTLGPTVAVDEVPGSDNVCVVPSAPHGQLLPKASLMVTHCGHGSTLKALSAGVPMVCIPMGRDQDDNAARVVELGAGLKLKRSATVEQIRSAVQRILGEPGFGAAARAAAARIAETRDAADAAAVIEAAVRSHAPARAVRAASRPSA